MKANLKGMKDGVNGKSHRKENNFHKEYSVITAQLKKLISCRIYWVGENCFCCLWVHGDNWGSGSGRTSPNSGGYHKESAAVSDAIESAGIILSEDIHGVGDRAIESALLAIANKLTKGKKAVFTAHA